jgi:hypothetical protein
MRGVCVQFVRCRYDGGALAAIVPDVGASGPRPEGEDADGRAVDVNGNCEATHTLRG